VLRINNELGFHNRYESGAAKIYADSFSKVNTILEDKINNSYN
jgi:hypothetical protein